MRDAVMAPVRGAGRLPYVGKRLFLTLFVGVAVVYAPVAISRMFWVYGAGAPGVLDRSTRRSMAWTTLGGPESVVGVRAADYAEHRLAMLVHTTLGGLALPVGAFQWLCRPRVSNTVHRLAGNAYLGLMALSMGAAGFGELRKAGRAVVGQKVEQSAMVDIVQ